ncbi:biopolymer transporter ExbD [Gemmata sp. G18]|uniref:Biopolymer transporter ExbD n=1 Tax=Gemmata palustris TaxID=2822762 RepID=A0ABS5BSB4_9BACT|nr:biopolymer transporter ExbD [Gemmata palustris]MBP3956601.1 biopolymer transporter ExbD [Gemmata palustris]
MSAWHVRKEGSPDVLALPTAGEVLTGLRDGNFLPTDEVRGPTDMVWHAIEVHPTFAEAAQDIDPPPSEEADDTHLDMNPLIDVCLVLLIFFILTITYASLERALDVPPDSAEDKGIPQISKEELKDRVFKVIVKMDGERPVIKIEGKEVSQEQIFTEMQNVINATGRKEILLDIDKSVPWGVETAILDAAKGNKVHNIINNQRSR